MWTWEHVLWLICFLFQVCRSIFIIFTILSHIYGILVITINTVHRSNPSQYEHFFTENREINGWVLNSSIFNIFINFYHLSVNKTQYFYNSPFSNLNIQYIMKYLDIIQIPSIFMVNCIKIYVHMVQVCWDVYDTSLEQNQSERRKNKS